MEQLLTLPKRNQEANQESSMDIYKWHHTKRAETQQHQTVLEIHKIKEKRQHWCFPIEEQKETGQRQQREGWNIDPSLNPYLPSTSQQQYHKKLST